MKEAEAIPIIPAVRLFVRRRLFGIIVALGQTTRNYEEAAVKITQVELYEVEIPPIPVIARYFPKHALPHPKRTRALQPRVLSELKI